MLRYQNTSHFLKLYDTSSSNKNFSKSQALWAGSYKNRIDKTGQMVWSQFPINIVVVYFGKLQLGQTK